MIDLHAHVLPGVDDGPRSMADAVELVRAARAAGTTTIAATPHIDVRYRMNARRVATGLAALREELAAAEVDVNVVSGGEIALEKLIDLGADELDRLGLGGGPTLLVEPPLRSLPGDWEWAVRRLLEAGRSVLLAHPERCPTFQREPGRLRALVDAGAYAQVTVGALVGDFGGIVRDTALRIFREGLVHDLASDMHDLGPRPPALSAGLEVLAAEGLATTRQQQAWLTASAPAAILAGSELPPRPWP
jgi:protein-tyrosine phosphatase